MKKICFVLFLVTIFPIYCEVLDNSAYLHHHLATIRDTSTDRAQFRKSLQKIGEYLAITSMEEMKLGKRDVETPLGRAEHLQCEELPILVTILRAGIPLLEGVQEVYPDSEVGFFAMARDEKTFVPEVGYIGVPDVKDKCVIIVDTMVGTANSVIAGIDYLKKQGAKNIVFLCAMTTKEGLDNIAAFDPKVKVIAANVDPILNEKKYIVPGLGDAGERS